MYKIAVIGDWDSILGFSALGLSVFPVGSVGEFEKTLVQVAKQDFAVIYITEQAAQNSLELLDRYKEQRTPALVLLPGKEGSLGIGMRNVHRSVEKAVGADILSEQAAK